MPGRGHLSFGFLNAEAYARQGNREQALEALRNGLQEGLHRFWWIQVDGSPHMDSLRDDPEFRALKANAKEKLADVLKGVREREARGELGPMPD
jgi:hypothetical protein